jgi:O-antigen/teichoic acid export membrane protein
LFARWRDSGRELKQLVVAVVTTTTAGGIILCVVVAGPVQQLVPSLLGRDWLDMQNVLVISALALAISGPISVAAAGALYAEGRAGAVLISVSMGAAAWILVLVPWLLIHAAPASVAGSWFVGAVVEAGAFSLFMRRGGFPVAAGVAWRVTVGCLIAAPALFVTRQVSSAEAAAIWFMVLSLLAALASFTNFGRFRDVWSLVRAGALG